jgi:membrane protein DedA with SNARE-associated domain
MPEYAHFYTSFFDHLISNYGLWALFALIVLESMGIPLPGEVALVGAAIFAGSTGQLSILGVVATAAVSVTLGASIGYVIGRTVGLRLLERHGPLIGLNADKLLVGRYLFLSHGGKIVFWGRFIAIMRVLAAVLAGVNEMRWWHFLAMNVLGAVVWACVFGFGAYFIGERVHMIFGPIGILFFIVAVGGIVGLFFYFKHHERDLIKRAREAFPDAVIPMVPVDTRA